MDDLSNLAHVRRAQIVFGDGALVELGLLARAGISRSWWALGLHVCTAVFATSAFYALWTRLYGLARLRRRK